ncbi:ankyrin [Trematosphaeria pertusa]|uniref:Ankyrin n=1 Tax=Trematosphaeria pertusa TaxID=390896 RepID=A0A6A6IDE5_9PLEO|nr:ankyrin [Trematosphaeria pertusa]KAF2248595.1 ankyrin [Trematosphaeria pertusa]
MDADGFTPLISAVREGFCLKAVNHIVRNSGEEIVNQADLSWDESPISWACERGQAETVKILLDAPNVHPNRRATGYRNRTPLQIALVYDRVAVIEILLDSPRVVPSWDIADEDGRKPLQYALEYCSEECIRALLLHSQTSAAIRIDALKIMAGMGNHEHIDIIKSILESVEEQSLPTSELDDLIHRFPTLDSNKTVFDAWMRRVKDPKRWNEVPHVLHTLALSGDGDTILRLLKLGANIYEPDDDNWTCIDVAKRNGNPKLKDVLMKHIPKPPPEKLPYLRPSSFANPFDEANVTLADFFKNNVANSFLEINVNFQETKFDRICVRTQQSIPPDDEYFYFEVHILAHPNGSYFAVGYTQVQVAANDYPGMVEGSWAYHGDDGGLFVQALGQGSSFSEKSDGEKYHTDSVVGCGLNMKTGKGYRTLNGKRLDSWDAFDEHVFKKGKIYPCVGFPTDSEGNGLHVRVVLRKSQDHPFLYGGPYI